ncbi:sporulation protein [Streptomyces lonegramiae]|uniref:Sporulation protein n=1 Tax=Streptomyces lonegramiae TaxID=3075524 RepID=A0ABU2XRM6_9ACTN|nr:sporulation protein [Streptomyces sp. DSM 41529]MDT0548231.1 sporulation protein [Streptomyces sp. DSM 41529]
MSREPNHRLAELMAEAGVSNKGLARRVRDIAETHGVDNGTTHVAVQRWLQGGGIKPQTAEFVAEALSGKLQRKLTLSDLGFVGAPVEARPIGTGYAASLAETLATLGGIAQLSPDDRPSDECLLPESEVNSAAFSWMISRPDDLIASLAATRRVDMKDVAAMRTVADTFTQLDFLYGGGHGHTTLRHYFKHEVIPLLNGSFSTKVGKALFGAASETLQVLGWTAYDSGQHSIANRYLLAALRLAQAADDRMLGACVLANLSHQANYLGLALRALQLARASVEGGKGGSTPRGMALFLAHEARALSTTHDYDGAKRAMKEAEKFFARADTTDDPEWISYMDEAELVGEFSHCFRDLKRGPEAVRFAERAVALTNPKYARTLGFVRMVLAQSQLLNGELEQAAATATQAVEAAEALQSARFQRYVKTFQKGISVHSGNPSVGEFNERVRNAMSRMDDE